MRARNQTFKEELILCDIYVSCVPPVKKHSYLVWCAIRIEYELIDIMQ